MSAANITWDTWEAYILQLNKLLLYLRTKYLLLSVHCDINCKQVADNKLALLGLIGTLNV